MIKDKICKGCGKKLASVYHTTRYCKSCLKERRKMSNAAKQALIKLRETLYEGLSEREKKEALMEAREAIMKELDKGKIS